MSLGGGGTAAQQQQQQGWHHGAKRQGPVPASPAVEAVTLRSPRSSADASPGAHAQGFPAGEENGLAQPPAPPQPLPSAAFPLPQQPRAGGRAPHDIEPEWPGLQLPQRAQLVMAAEEYQDPSPSHTNGRGYASYRPASHYAPSRTTPQGSRPDHRVRGAGPDGAPEASAGGDAARPLGEAAAAAAPTVAEAPASGGVAAKAPVVAAGAMAVATLQTPAHEAQATIDVNVSGEPHPAAAGVEPPMAEVSPVVAVALGHGLRLGGGDAGLGLGRQRYPDSGEDEEADDEEQQRPAVDGGIEALEVEVEEFSTSHDNSDEDEGPEAGGGEGRPAPGCCSSPSPQQDQDAASAAGLSDIAEEGECSDSGDGCALGPGAAERSLQRVSSRFGLPPLSSPLHGLPGSQQQHAAAAVLPAAAAPQLGDGRASWMQRAMRKLSSSMRRSGGSASSVTSLSHSKSMDVTAGQALRPGPGSVGARSASAASSASGTSSAATEPWPAGDGDGGSESSSVAQRRKKKALWRRSARKLGKVIGLIPRSWEVEAWHVGEGLEEVAAQTAALEAEREAAAAAAKVGAGPPAQERQ